MRIDTPGRFVFLLLTHSSTILTLLACHSCACDVPAHSYTYSFEPSPSWSSVYAGSAEIAAYFRGFCQKYNLGRYIRTRHEIVGAQWDEVHSRWDVRITDLAIGTTFVDTCHVLVNA